MAANSFSDGVVSAFWIVLTHGSPGASFSKDAKLTFHASVIGNSTICLSLAELDIETKRNK